jgi:hypothetical protein
MKNQSMLAAREERISRKLKATRMAQHEAFNDAYRTGRRAFVISLTPKDYESAHAYCKERDLIVEAIVPLDSLSELLELLRDGKWADRVIVASELPLRDLISLLSACRASKIKVDRLVHRGNAIRWIVWSILN